VLVLFISGEHQIAREQELALGTSYLSEGPSTASPSSQKHSSTLGTQVGDAFEGVLMRKHTYDSLDRKAANRTWEKLYVVLQNGEIYFFKDQKHRQEGSTHRGESGIPLSGCSIRVADYSKKKHVLSLRLPVGAEYLLQAHDEDDMNRWLSQLQYATGQAETQPSPPPASSQSSKSKKGGFFSRSKK
jgi:spectrin beta